MQNRKTRKTQNREACKAKARGIETQWWPNKASWRDRAVAMQQYSAVDVWAVSHCPSCCCLIRGCEVDRGDAACRFKRLQFDLTLSSLASACLKAQSRHTPLLRALTGNQTRRLIASNDRSASKPLESLQQFNCTCITHSSALSRITSHHQIDFIQHHSR